MRRVHSRHPAKLRVVETLKDFLMLSVLLSNTSGNIGTDFFLMVMVSFSLFSVLFSTVGNVESWTVRPFLCSVRSVQWSLLYSALHELKSSLCATSFL